MGILLIHILLSHALILFPLRLAPTLLRLLPVWSEVITKPDVTSFNGSLFIHSKLNHFDHLMFAFDYLALFCLRLK